MKIKINNKIIFHKLTYTFIHKFRYMMANQDPLNTAAGKLEIYKAISNPAYICHTSDDPILTVFHLVRELKELAGMYMIFHKQYEELAETTEIFAVDLIG